MRNRNRSTIQRREMEWSVWKPQYLRIMDDLGFDIRADMESAKILSNLVEGKRIPNYCTIVEMLGQHVSIVAPASSMEEEVGRMPKENVIISAGSATKRLMRMGVVPDIIVTDLDGDTDYEIDAVEKGALAFIHAHGDNIDKIRDIVPKLKSPFVPTVQCQPFSNVYNFGGFTDGDRAFLISLHFGVTDIDLVGWDLKVPYPKEGCDIQMKLRKMGWARKILFPYIGSSTFL